MIISIAFSGCRDKNAERKIDANLKTRLLQLKETNDLDKRVTILFRINEDLTELHHEVMENKGVEISTNIGSIYTATIPAKSIYGFAKMRFIDYIQGQTTLKTHPADSTSIKKF